MQIRTVIWILPAVSTIILSLGLAINVYFSSDLLSTISTTQRVDYPLLESTKTLSLFVQSVADRFKEAVDEGDRKRFAFVELDAEKVRKQLVRISQIENQRGVSERIGIEFEDYYAKAFKTARLMLLAETGDQKNAIDNMQNAFTVLRADLAKTNAAAQKQFQEGIERSAENVHNELNTSIFVALTVIISAVAASLFIVRINQNKTELQQYNAALRELNAKLADAQAALVVTARQAGMAEIATNVLHNVGNVLNSVNISADVIRGMIRSSKSPGLAKAVQMLNDHGTTLGDFLVNNEKGKLLPAYLGKLAIAWNTEQQSIVTELASLTRSVDHINEIVATQQSYAGSVSIIELVKFDALVDDALRMNGEALTRHQVTVVKDCANIPDLSLDKHRILQILINLISNAKYAMSSVTDRPHILTIRANLFAEKKVLQIAVVDTGVGIPAENLSRIFQHGFTTSKKGHGFGLHSCAIAAKELGGTLSVHSDGPECGAIFLLEIPANEDSTARISL